MIAFLRDMVAADGAVRATVEPAPVAEGAVPAGSLVFAFVVAGIVLLATGHNPLHAYNDVFEYGFIHNGALGETLITATPLAFTGLAAAAAFRMRLFNIGAEGQL
jgi:simple sugar transport system permease protein